MPTLQWVGKDKVVNHHLDVPFRVLNKVSSFRAPEGTPANSTDNRIIHGDNLEALKSLLPEFEGKVKCIYIDPPYNTGNEGWDATISFDDVETEVYRVDLEQLGEENYAPKAFKLAVNERARFTAYLLSLPQESQIANLVSRITELIGNMYPITDPEVKEYVGRIVVGMSAEQMRDCIERDVAYVRKIKKKISALADVHAVKAFTDLLDVDRIVLQPGFKLPESITPSANASAVPKSLYVTEAAMGDFERRLINDIANLESVQWWHRNLSRGKGFRINGFLNHYPDFIVKTKAGKIIALETKGDDRDNGDSELKLKLGKLWGAKAGRDYRYTMVFDNNPIEGAERRSDALKKIGQL